MTKKDSQKAIDLRSNDLSSKKDSRDAVESAISGAKGDRRITWEASIARTNKKVARWEDSESTNRRKRSTAA